MRKLFMAICVLLWLSGATGQDSANSSLSEDSSTASGGSDQDSGISIYTYYLRENCGGIPNRVDSGHFTDVACDAGCQNLESSWKSGNVSCNNYNYDEYQDFVASLFQDTSYLLIEAFTYTCDHLNVSSAIIASGSCEQATYGLYAGISKFGICE